MQRSLVAALALATLLVADQALSQAPDTNTVATKPTLRPGRVRPDPGLYVHAGFGFGGGAHQSDLARSLFNDEFSIKSSGHTQLLLRTGLRNIAQAEYRWVDGAHSFKNEFPPGGVLGNFESIEMDFDTSEWLLKLNPLAFVVPRHLGLFAVVGRGKAEWRDESNDGFRGTTKLVGAEAALLSGAGALHLGLVRSEFRYDRVTLGGGTAPAEVPATGWSLYLNFSFGPRLWSPARRAGSP